MGKEIEKKYLVNINDVPNDIGVNAANSKLIHQTYLATGEEELRIRMVEAFQQEEKFYLTIKCGSGLVREEMETEIKKETYRQLADAVNFIPLMKTRYTFEYQGNVFELDNYHNMVLNELAVVEIEFKTEKDAVNFERPEWLGEDVTEDKQYKNQNLWKKVNAKQ